MILVLNAGSSSLKFAVFDEDLTRQISGSATEIGGASVLSLGKTSDAVDLPDHRAALAMILEGLAGLGYGLGTFSVAAHRTLHGGTGQTSGALVTPRIIACLAEFAPLAPLHVPAELDSIAALTQAAPDLVQVASFDTAFHATNPDVATRYALPERPETDGIRRYGFHGISFAGLTAEVARRHGGQAPARLLALHLGNGASLCAIRDGASVATTMGYSPLSGLTMGTRTGDIDGNAVLRLAESLGVEGAGRLLNSESGLLGLGGASDMRALGKAGTSEAEFAIRHFVYWCIRHAGSMMAAMGGLDAVAFTGGIGENDTAVRAGILDGLAWTGLHARPRRQCAQRRPGSRPRIADPGAYRTRRGGANHRGRSAARVSRRDRTGVETGRLTSQRAQSLGWAASVATPAAGRQCNP